MLPDGQTTIGDLYEKYKDIDGFMYINYSEDNPFWKYVLYIVHLMISCQLSCVKEFIYSAQ